MSSATRTRRVLFREHFPTTFGRLNLFFDVCFSKCQPRGVTAKDVCRRSWLLQRILLCHCDPIVPAVPLREAAHSAASEQNHICGMTAHTVKVLYNTVQYFVLVKFQFKHKTQKNTRFWSKCQFFYSSDFGHMVRFSFIHFLISRGSGLSKGPFDAVPQRGLGCRYAEDFQEGGRLYPPFGCRGCSLHLCAISWAGVLDLVSTGFLPSII